jgi:hypothetical protein
MGVEDVEAFLREEAPEPDHPAEVRVFARL